MKSSMFNFQLQWEDTIFTYRLHIHVYTFGNYSFVKYSCSSKLSYIKYFKWMATKNYEIPVFHIHLTFVGIFLVDLSKTSSHTTNLQFTVQTCARWIWIYLTYFLTHFVQVFDCDQFQSIMRHRRIFAVFGLLYILFDFKILQMKCHNFNFFFTLNNTVFNAKLLHF